MQPGDMHSDEKLTFLKRQCVASFMDENPDAFAPPSTGTTWQDAWCHPAPSEADRRTMDKALGMLAGMFRTAQATVSDQEPLSEMLSPQRLPGVETLEPDPGALMVMGGDTDEGAIAFARSITIYKSLLDAGMVSEEALRLMLNGTLDALPGDSPLMRSLIGTCQRMTQIDLDHIFTPQ